MDFIHLNLMVSRYERPELNIFSCFAQMPKFGDKTFVPFRLIGMPFRVKNSDRIVR